MPDLILNHSLTDDGTTLKISIAGRLVIDTVSELQHLFMEQSDKSDTFLLDLSAVNEIDLAGMQLICSACRTFLDAKKHFNLDACMAVTVKTAIGSVGLQRQTSCKHNADLPCIWCGGMN